MLKFKKIDLSALFLAVMLVLFAGCSDDDSGSARAWLAAETVDCETITNQLLSSGDQMTLAAEITAQSGDDAWCSFSSFTDGGVPVLETAGTVGTPIDLFMLRNETETDRVATIRVAFANGYSSTLTLTQQAFTPTPWYDRQWGEQPAYRDDASYIYKTYYTTLQRGGYVRNYSICFDTEKRVSHWVAYPLTTNYVEPALDRTDEWAYDPNNQLPVIPESDQAYIIQSYGGGPVRGHQLPSADRYSNIATNNMTFYATNIMPQDFDFNGGIWKQLESKVRYNMKMNRQDTIFVVTGTYFGDSKTITDRRGNRIAYPTNCWKVLLRSSGGRKVWESTADYLHGIGFWFSNSDDNTSTSLRSYSTTIADIEQKTGFTFFRNLSAEAAAGVKAQNKPSDWGI